MKKSLNYRIFENRPIYRNLDVKQSAPEVSSQQTSQQTPKESFAEKACRIITFGRLCNPRKAKPEPKQNIKSEPGGIEDNAKAVIAAQEAAEKRGEKLSPPKRLLAFLRGKN